MAAVGAKYGVANFSATYSAELCELYDLYLSSCLPSGDTPFVCVPPPLARRPSLPLLPSSLWH